jgi:NAD(P)-dependent dehydrogenase (short-subunit alcohol dehydrogenase family)
VPDGIRVNAVAPGFTRTPRVDTVAPAAQAAMLARVPMGRLADPAEIAAAVAFLASDDGSFCVGETVSPNGGFVTV